jgi:hypothetical protein
MKRIVIVIAACALAVSLASAQVPPQSIGSSPEPLSLEQKTRISQLVTRQTAPLASANFSIALDSVVPADIQVRPIPAEAEHIAPQLIGFGYIVVEELVAIVDPRTRKVEIVFPRWAEP